MTDPRKTYDPRGDAIALDALERRALEMLMHHPARLLDDTAQQCIARWPKSAAERILADLIAFLRSRDDAGGEALRARLDLALDRAEKAEACLLDARQRIDVLVKERDEARAEREAERFLQRLASDGGTIVSSNDCSPSEIAVARAFERLHVDDRAYGYVHRPRARAYVDPPAAPKPPAGEGGK